MPGVQFAHGVHQTVSPSLAAGDLLRRIVLLSLDVLAKQRIPRLLPLLLARERSLSALVKVDGLVTFAAGESHGVEVLLGSSSLPARRRCQGGRSFPQSILARDWVASALESCMISRRFYGKPLP